MDRKIFFDLIRKDLGRFTIMQVRGFERFLDEAARRGTPLDHLAYILATVWHETARTMQPVREGLGRSDAWRKRNLRYYPWYGRGDIQLTWETNYKRAGDIIGVDLIANPDLALDPEISVKIAFEGMEGGWFTGKALNDYLDGKDESDKEDLREFTNARRIINGVDKQVAIGKLGLIFEHALRASGYDVPAAIEFAADEEDDAMLAPPVPTSRPAGPVPEVPAADPGQVVVEKAATPVDPVTEKPLTPIEQMNKPVQGAKAGLVGGGVLAAAILIANRVGLIPESLQDTDAQLAILMVVPWLGGQIGSFVGSYRARDKRFPVQP